MTGRYEVIAAENGRIGVDLATKYSPDLILCDIMMPELDGYGVLYMLSKIERTASIPFIFLTAKSERGDMRKAMEMGADDYLTKPFDDVELMNAIEVRLKKHEQLKQEGAPKAELQLSKEEQETILNELIAESRAKTLKKKQTIYETGDTPLYAYYVKSGKIRNFLYYLDGRELSTAIHVQNGFFGYEAILLNEKYSDNAEALEESEIVLIPKDNFMELLFRKPVIAERFIKLLSGNIREKEEQLLGFAYDSVRKRVANALINVAEKHVDTAKEDECLIRISRDGLAALAGTANETISRVLADFKDERLITKEGNAIRIFSVRKLRSIKQ